MEPKKPNVVILYADDLGYGDVSCYGAQTLSTPNIDRLAAEGRQFMDGYASAATCTPSRYSILTGSYPWRNPRANILPGDAPMIMEPGSPTIASMFQEAGYSTAVVGKWHLGLGDGSIDWNGSIEGCPLDVGFDHSYIMAATNDRVPCVYVDGRHVVGLDPADPIEISYGRDNPFPDLPTGRDNPELLRMQPSHGHDMTIVNGVSRIGYMRGGSAALWTDETMAEVFAEQACSFIKDHSEDPFFLYYAFHQPHVPRLPGPRFAGQSGLGPRGDVILELDWCVGEILHTLDELGLAEDTIVIFSSDNGPVLDDGYHDDAVTKAGAHKPAGKLRGGKYSMYDGGTRVPFLLRWSGTVAPGQSDALVSHIDFYASLASIIDQPLPTAAAPDSLDLSPAFVGEDAAGRSELVLEGIQAKTVLREDDWVYIPPHKGPAVNQNTNIETGNSLEPQLFDLNRDLEQQKNMALEHPSRMQQMDARLHAIRQSSQTRPVS